MRTIFNRLREVPSSVGRSVEKGFDLENPDFEGNEKEVFVNGDRVLKKYDTNNCHENSRAVRKATYYLHKVANILWPGTFHEIQSITQINSTRHPQVLTWKTWIIERFRDFEEIGRSDSEDRDELNEIVGDVKSALGDYVYVMPAMMLNWSRAEDGKLAFHEEMVMNGYEEKSKFVDLAGLKKYCEGREDLSEKDVERVLRYAALHNGSLKAQEEMTRALSQEDFVMYPDYVSSYRSVIKRRISEEMG